MAGVDCFFTKSPEGKRKIRQLEEDYEVVDPQNFAVTTSRLGTIEITVVYYDKEKVDRPFSDEDWDEFEKRVYKS